MDYKTELIEHIPQIERIVKYVSRNHEMADDLTQECCLKIIEKEALWKPERGTFQHWVNAVSRNLTISKLKSKQVKDKRDKLYQNDYQRDPVEMDADEEIFDTDKVNWVIEQFDTLPRRQKEILHCRYYKQMRVSEIAEHLGLAQGTVSRQIRLGLEKLKSNARKNGLMSWTLPLLGVASGEKFMSGWMAKLMGFMMLASTTTLALDQGSEPSLTLAEGAAHSFPQLTLPVAITNAKEEVGHKGLVAHWTLDERTLPYQDSALNAERVKGFAAKAPHSPDTCWKIKGFNRGSAMCDGQTSWALGLQNKELSRLTHCFTLTTWFTTEVLNEGVASLIGMSEKGTRNGWSVGRQGAQLMWRPWGDEARVLEGIQLKENHWYFLVVEMLEPGEMVLHLYGENGQAQIAMVNHDKPFIETSPESVVLGSSFYARDYWKGLIDDVRIYDHRLSVQEMKNVAAGGHVKKSGP